MKCYRCQAEITEKSRFCPDCGWADLPHLEDDECFDALRELPEYNQMIHVLKKRKILSSRK